jgi:glycylpeptide N-tetradecanoyltransferase
MAHCTRLRIFVPKGEVPSEADGFIEPSKPPEEVRQEPYPLPSTFEWTVVDITDPGQVSN